MAVAPLLPPLASFGASLRFVLAFGVCYCGLRCVPCHSQLPNLEIRKLCLPFLVKLDDDDGLGRLGQGNSGGRRADEHAPAVVAGGHGCMLSFVVL